MSYTMTLQRPDNHGPYSGEMIEWLCRNVDSKNWKIGGQNREIKFGLRN